MVQRYGDKGSVFSNYTFFKSPIKVSLIIFPLDAHSQFLSTITSNSKEPFKSG